MWYLNQQSGWQLSPLVNISDIALINHCLYYSGIRSSSGRSSSSSSGCINISNSGSGSFKSISKINTWLIQDGPKTINTYSNHHPLNKKLHLSLLSELSELRVCKFLMVKNTRKANEFFKFLLKVTRFSRNWQMPFITPVYKLQHYIKAREVLCLLYVYYMLKLHVCLNSIVRCPTCFLRKLFVC